MHKLTKDIIKYLQQKTSPRYVFDEERGKFCIKEVPDPVAARWIEHLEGMEEEQKILHGIVIDSQYLADKGKDYLNFLIHRDSKKSILEDDPDEQGRLE